MMQTSPAGVAALAAHEGIVRAPYLDSVGVWTIGIGHTAGAGDPKPAAMAKGVEISLAEVFAIFRRDIARFEADVNRAVKVPLKQHEFDALVSFHFNTGGIAKAKLTEALNRGDRAGAADGFMGWLKPPEIRRRREAEQRLFRDGVYPGGSVPIYGVTAKNKPGAVKDLIPAAAVAGLISGGSSTVDPIETRFAALEERIARLEMGRIAG